MPGRRALALGLTLAGICFFSLLTLVWGSVELSLADVGRALFFYSENDTAGQIVWELRLPRLAAAILGGAGLSLSGLLCRRYPQSPGRTLCAGREFWRKPGVALLMLAGWGAGTLGVLSAASLGAGAVLALVLTLARWVRSPVSLLVLGLMVSYVVDAAVSVLIHFSSSEELRGYVLWSFGSFGRLPPEQVPWLTACIGLGALLSLFCLKYLNGVALGEEGALSLGIDVRRSRLLALAAASLLAAAVSAFCGPIGFIGMAVPHLARGLFKSANHRILVPGSMLVGALLALVAGWLVQWPGEGGSLPLGAVTSLMGAPVAIWILLPRKGRVLD